MGFSSAQEAVCGWWNPDFVSTTVSVAHHNIYFVLNVAAVAHLSSLAPPSPHVPVAAVVWSAVCVDVFPAELTCLQVSFAFCCNYISFLMMLSGINLYIFADRSFFLFRFNCKLH